MKILIVSSYFGSTLGGALNFIKALSSELARRGHSISIALDSRYRSQFQVSDVDLIWFNSSSMTNYSPSLSFLKIIQRTNADVIHLNGYMSFQTDWGSFIASFRKIPVILTPHGSLLGYSHLSRSAFEKIPYFFHELFTLKLAPKLAKFVITTSNAEFKDAIRYGINPKKIKLIPLSFITPNNLFTPDHKSSSQKLLFVGRIVPNKNLETLFFSLQQILKKKPNVELLIVGEDISGRIIGDQGYKNKLFNIIEKLGIKNNVKFLGFKTGQDLWKIYQDSHIMVCSSTYENFGLPLLEAAFFGKPIVSTDVGVARDIIGENQGGEIIKQGDFKEMVNSVLELLEDENKYQKASEFVRLRSKNYAISLIADKYEQVFQDANK